MNRKFIIKATGLSKSFAAKQGREITQALAKVDIEACEGSMTAIIGPDGAGKTTFMRLVCGLLSRTEGELEVLGLDVQKNSQRVQEQLGYMLQRFGLYEDLSVRENMDLYADLHGISKELREQRFAKLLAMAGLTPFQERLAGKLSGGMKQKLGLVCTLVRSPKLLLLDEPTVGVDPLSRRDLWQILQQLVAEEKLTVLVSTAYMEEAELCEHVYVLHKGRVLAHGTPEELRQLTSGQCYKMQLPEGKPARLLGAALLEDREHVVDAVPDGGAVRFVLKQGAQLEQLLAYRYLGHLHTQRVPSRLEDSFMLLLHEAEQENQGVSIAVDYQQGVKLHTEKDIEVKNLLRKFGDFIAVNRTSFDVHRGEIFGLLGPNGAGKTTTFRMLCGLLPASDGEAQVAGMNMRTARTQARANLGYVAQKFSLYSDLSVDENLRFFGGAYGLFGKKLAERMESVKGLFGLTHLSDVQAGSLPGGYKQRLSMAVGLIHGPRILFLDEPTSGIDPLARREFWRQITALAASGTTIIITTHFMDEAEYCDRMMIQDAGTCIAIGTPREILRQGKDASTMNDAFIAIVEQGRSKEAQHA